MLGGANCYYELNGMEMSTLVCDGTRYRAFSGDGPHRNNFSSIGVPNGGPIPTGRYYIIHRQSGGRFGWLYDSVSGRDKWFALYREDGAIDDETFVEGVRRGQFRLHPLGPRRMSTGCVVLQYPSEFDALSVYLDGMPEEFIPETGIRIYGMLAVTYVDDSLDPRYRSGSDGFVVA